MYYVESRCYLRLCQQYRRPSPAGSHGAGEMHYVSVPRSVVLCNHITLNSPLLFWNTFRCVVTQHSNEFLIEIEYKINYLGIDKGSKKVLYY